MSAERLFKPLPLKLGRLELKHRMVMAPLTRFRADADHVPSKDARLYYEQRACVPGTFMVTEATLISPRAGGYRGVPGIWSDAQTEGWKEITEAVHAKGSYIYLQLWALGRVAKEDVLQAEGGHRLVSSSAVPVDASQTNMKAETGVPAAMTEEEIQLFIQDFAHAARNAMKAGFDGVEIHGANGYLIDQFWQDVVNHRSDQYGGSVENRARFGLEVTRAVIEAVGDNKKVSMRLSPWANFQGMGMKDPVPQFRYITEELKKLGLSYLHLVESRISGSSVDGVYHDFNRENEPFVEAWGTDAPVLMAGGFTPEKASSTLTQIYKGDNICIVFGRYFIANPDLAFRIPRGIELSHWDRSTFYKPGPEGYIDYKFSKEFLEQQSRL